MPRYEQLKAKSKGISYTRRIRNDDKEFNFKKPIIISVSFILLVSILFTIIKKYSPMVDIAVKDFFSINHREALTLETTGSENENKISFLDNVPLFNFFIKSNTNETLSIMAYETNSMLETSVNTNTTQNNSTITRESLSVFFNNNQNSTTNYIEEQKDNNIIEEQNNIVNESYNYIQEMIQQNRSVNNNNNSTIKEDNNLENKNNNNIEENNNYLEKVTNSINNKPTQENTIANNSNISSSIFYDILKPKENTARDIKTMRPATTTYSSTPPSYMRNNNEPKEKYNTNNYNYYFRGDKKEENNYNSRERVITSGNNSNNDDKQNTAKKPSIKNNSQQDYERLADSLVNNNNITEKRNNTAIEEKTISKRDLIVNSQTSVIPNNNNNSIIKNNNDYNRVINDLVNPNNTERIINNNERTINNTERQINNNNNNIVREENKIINTKENINKKEIIQKAQKDIAKYKTSKANNSVKRDYSNERNLKNTNNEGVYLVEYDENTGSITLIFRSRNIANNNSIEDTIKTLLDGATDEENKNNIISCIPKDTELLDIFVEGNTVYLNFNESFEFNPLGNEGTMLQIYQLVYTATQFEGIDNVIFLIDGNLNETIGAEGAIENMPFKRFE